jgi:MFS family permease
MTLVEGCVDVLIVLTALEVLGIGDGGVGVLNSGWGVGGIAGGAVALALLRRGRLASGMSAGALLVAAAMIGIGVWPTVAGAVALLVAVGVGYTLVEVASATLLQRLASDEVLGRVFGVLETSYVTALGFGSLLAPALVALAGVRGALIVTGLGVVILVLITRHALAQLEAGIPVPEREYELLRAHGLFAPLPPAIVENLALRLRRVDVPAGGVVVREGEPGDRFYVVDSGSFEVLRDGARVAVCEPGDCFGEIALLRDVPRQATVRALGDGRLVALERDDFLQSIGAHARSTSAAEALVVARGG